MEKMRRVTIEFQLCIGIKRSFFAPSLGSLTLTHASILAANTKLSALRRLGKDCSSRQPIAKCRERLFQQTPIAKSRERLTAIAKCRERLFQQRAIAKCSCGLC